MNNEDYSKMNNYVDLHLQSIRRIHITVEVLDDDLNIIETIEGMADGGSISVSGESLIRRTGNLSFVLNDLLIPRKESLLWMTNKIRVYAGIQDMSSSDSTITHFCLGTYYITEPSISINSDTRNVSITLEDYMMKWEQEETEESIVIEAETPMNTAMTMIMNKVGEFNLKVEFSDLKIPYKLEYPTSTKISDIILAIRDMYMDWECYYDTEGYFVYRKMLIQREDDTRVVWSYVGKANSMTGFDESFAYKEVKNKVVVIGQMNEKTGLTPRATSIVTNTDSPFHANEIGERRRVITDATYSNLEQCDSRARFELFKLSSFQEQITITSPPIYFLDANNVIEVENMATREIENYVIDSISFGLSVGEDMSISGHKLYYEDYESNGAYEEIRKIADNVIEGIMNRGWLSLSETRIEEYFGLVGGGSKLTVNFEKGGLYGTTAYTTAYLGTKNQVLTIDLDDFKSSDENGDTGAGKSEYSDRILGHEVVHIVMNDSIGIEKTSVIPTWFKEGASEFIHGADERLKKAIVSNGVIQNSKLNELINKAYKMMIESVWDGVTEDYAISYVACKYIDYKMLSGLTYKTLMSQIKTSSKKGDEALRDAISYCTGLSYNDFALSFKSNAFDYISNRMSLNLNGDELDTGSIGGINHRGNKNLSAEDIFNNDLAIKNLSLKNFEVDFVKP